MKTFLICSLRMENNPFLLFSVFMIFVILYTVLLLLHISLLF